MFVEIRYEEERTLINIDSKIFRDGSAWFELDKIYDSCRNRRTRSHKNDCKTYLGFKNMYGGQEYPPAIQEFDDMKLRKSLYREHHPETRIHHKVENLRQIEESLKEKWTDIESEELNLKNLVESYDTFIRLNEEKRKSSRKKIEYYKERNKDLDAKITDIRKQNNYFRNINKAISEETKKYTQYQTFCSKAAKLKGFGSPMQYIMRYLSLKEAGEKVMLKNNETTIQLVGYLCQLNTNRTTKLDAIESLSAKCSEQKENHRHAKNMVLNKQKLLSAIQQETLKRLREIVQTFFGVLNIYNLIRYRHSDRKYIPMKNFGKQMQYIYTNMGCIETVYEKVKSNEEEQEESSGVNPSEFVYSMNHCGDESDRVESNSKTRMDEILKSLNEIQKFARREQDETDSENVSFEYEYNKKKAKFAETFPNYGELGIEKKIFERTKLTDPTCKYTKYSGSSISNAIKHPVSRNVSKVQNRASETSTKKQPKVEITTIASSKKISRKITTPLKKDKRTDLGHSKQIQKSTTSFNKSLCSSTINIELQNLRRLSIRKNQSRTEHFENDNFSVNDDGTLTIFSN